MREFRFDLACGRLMALTFWYTYAQRSCISDRSKSVGNPIYFYIYSTSDDRRETGKMTRLS